MYDDLLTELRFDGEEYKNLPRMGHFCEMMLKAADAIEAMSEYVNTMRRLKCEGWYLQQTKFHDGYHAVSTMPLPELPEEET